MRYVPSTGASTASRNIDTMRGWCVLVAIGCGSSHRAAPSDGVTIDVDAAADTSAQPDAPADAMLSTASPSCTTTPTILFDTSPSLISNIAQAGNILYVGTYNGSSGAVLAIDPTTGSQVATPLTTTGTPRLSVSDNVVYVGDAASAGSIWKWVPGDAPSELVPGRPYPTTVTTDGTYVYWSEQDTTPPNDVIQRRLLTGTTITKVMSCNLAQDLFVVDGTLYCPAYLVGDILYALADGTSTSTNSMGYAPGAMGTGYPIASTILDRTDLYFVNLYNNPELYRAPLPAGPSVLLTESPDISRYSGLAATADYFYAVDIDRGIDQIRRSDNTVTTIYPVTGLADDPVLWNGQLYVAGSNPMLSGQRYVMHCID